jgi:hypothetical protein
MVRHLVDVVQILYFGQLHLIVIHVVIPAANKIINFTKFMMTRDLSEWSWEEGQLDSIEGVILKYLE